MINAKLKGVNTTTKRLADGSTKIYYYHRGTGERLPGTPGSQEFIAAYHNASQSPAARIRGTLKYIIADYVQSNEFLKLAVRTRRDYLKQIAIIEAKYAVTPMRVLEDKRFRRHIIKWRDKLAETSKKQADYAVTVLRLVLAHGVDMGELDYNRAAGVKSVYKSDRADIIWLPENVAAFMDCASYELRLALILALHTGQRQGDLRRAAWTNWDGEYLTIRQSKTGAKVQIRATVALKAALDEAPRRAATILTTRSGAPWKEDHFRHQWRECTIKAAQDGLRFNDLRGTAVTMLAEAGCTVPEICAITGHTPDSANKIINRYLAKTRNLADAAITKFEASKNARFANQLQTGPKKGI